MSAESILMENQWNPITLGKKKERGGYQISSYEVSSSWYNAQMENTGARRRRLENYYHMDKSSVEVSQALDITAEDVSSCNADEEDTFFLEYPEGERFLKSTMKTLDAVKELWADRTGMDEHLFKRVRNTLQYGATFWFKKPDGCLKKLHTERMVGYILDHEDEEIVTHYIYDKSIPLLGDEQTNTRRRRFDQNSQEDKLETYSVDQLVILKNGEGPFGESILENVFPVWRQMMLIEQAVVIYRVVRAPERRIYYIDTGNLQGPKRDRAINKQRLSLMQKKTNRNGTLETEYDPHSTSEDIFIPTNSQGKGSRVETLKGGDQLGELNDLTYFERKLKAGLRIPNSMLDVHGDQREQFSDMRVGQVYQVEVRYMGYVRRISRQIARVLDDHLKAFALRRDIQVPPIVTLNITPPMSFSVYKDVELNQTLLNVFNSTLQINSLSKRIALEKYLNLDPEEVVENEVEKLREKGLSEGVIKTMPTEVVSNIVYGDGRLGEEYGIPKDDGGRF